MLGGDYPSGLISLGGLMLSVLDYVASRTFFGADDKVVGWIKTLVVTANKRKTTSTVNPGYNDKGYTDILV